jgi:alpha-tubulin suppressor-like RCC1 family protein
MKFLIALTLFFGLGIVFSQSAALGATDTGADPGIAVTPVISSVSAGAEHTCMVRDATVWCTGSNTRGQLGTGTLTKTIAFSPSLMTNALMVDAAGTTSCAVRIDATLWCWGTIPTSLDLATAGIITTDSTIPVQIPLTNVRTVAVGVEHTCAILQDDTVWCWGRNARGQLGNNTQKDSVVPVRANIDSVRSLDVGAEHTCAVRRTGSVWCWGSNGYHRLGLRPKGPFLVPTYVPKVLATTIATGDAFTCIISTNTHVQCWGRNQFGQLARTAGASRIAPHTTSIKNPVGLTAGSEFACAITTAATTWCWGRNRFGQLSNGTSIASAKPQKILTNTNIGPLTSLGAGSSHVCAIANTSGAMWCWGLGSQGQLGDGGSGAIGIRSVGTEIWPNGVRMKSIGTDQSARIVAAGDIACDDNRRTINNTGPIGTQCGDYATASLISTLKPDGIFALGDLQYESASSQELMTNYNQSWGPLRATTYPVRGNHEYITTGANGYVNYFSQMSPSYWITDAGGWRIIAVDSWCQGQIYAGCSATSAQTQWLKSELQRARDESKCTAVLMHHPFVSSGSYATSSVKYLWETAVSGGADLMMTGHDHIYERFTPLDATGAPEAGGMHLFINGLGGAPALPIGEPVAGSAFRYNANHGVLSFTLTPRAFSWAFISALDGSTVDSGSSSCTP